MCYINVQLYRVLMHSRFNRDVTLRASVESFAARRRHVVISYDYISYDYVMKT